MSEYVEGVITAAQLTPFADNDPIRVWAWLNVQYPDGCTQVYRWPGPLHTILERLQVGTLSELVGRRVESRYVGRPVLNKAGNETGGVTGRYPGFYPSRDEKERERGWLYLLCRIKDEEQEAMPEEIEAQEAEEVEQLELV